MASLICDLMAPYNMFDYAFAHKIGITHKKSKYEKETFERIYAFGFVN